MALVIRPVRAPPSRTCAIPLAASPVGGAAGVLKSAGCGGDLTPLPAVVALPAVLGPACASGCAGGAAAAADCVTGFAAAAAGAAACPEEAAAGAELAAAEASCKAWTARVCIEVSSSSWALSASSLCWSSSPLQCQRRELYCSTPALPNL